MRTWIKASGIALALVVVLGGGAYLMWSRGAETKPDQAGPDPLLVRFHVVGDSMSPTIKDADWLLIRQQQLPQRGDIAVIHIPDEQSKLFCRRIVAVGGDKVVTRTYSNVKITTVYNSQHPEGALYPDNVKPEGSVYEEREIVVKDQEFFAVGDNAVPGASYDSDEWGTIGRSDIVGIVKQRTTPNPRSF
jgi:signal peptidase I